MAYLRRPYPFKFFKGCLPQILLSPFFNTLSQIFLEIVLPIESTQAHQTNVELKDNLSTSYTIPISPWLIPTLLPLRLDPSSEINSSCCHKSEAGSHLHQSNIIIRSEAYYRKHNQEDQQIYQEKT